MPPPRMSPVTSFLFRNHRHHQHNHPSKASYYAPFSTSSRLRATSRDPTYYEILDVPVTATTAEIKKKFYSLSLRHHPDRNRSDPNASSRFAKISSAYQVLGHEGKRAIYDRDHGIHAHHPSHPSSPRGSHSSYSSAVNKGGSYAGSRPASGLSKRRGPFRGPPPSFYAHGGYGSRRAPPHAGPKGKDEDDPTGFIDRNPVHHFNARGHFRTQNAEDIRRNARRSRVMRDAIREQEVGSSGDFIFRFIVVCGILAVASAIPGLFWGKDEKLDVLKERKKKEG